MSLVVIKPATSAAPMTVELSGGAVGGNSSPENTGSLTKTKAQQLPFSLSEKKYVPSIRAMVRPAVTLGSNRVCQSGCALLANSARCSASAILGGSGVLVFVDSPYPGAFKNRSTKAFGLEMSRTVCPSWLGLHL